VSVSTLAAGLILEYSQAASGDIISGTHTKQSLYYPECPAERSSSRTCVHPGDDVVNPQHRKMIQVLTRRLEAAGHSLRGTAMDLAWTCRPPTVDAALRRRSGRGSNILVTSVSAVRESLSDGGVPGRGPTQPIAPYRPNRHSAELSI
jgi:hypothetical protein